MRRYMNIKEFRDLGVLQELNRQFLHPLGLALEVVEELVEGGDGVCRLSGIWDERDDPEGIAFSDDQLSGPDATAKAQRVAELRSEKAAARIALLGAVVQPLGGA